MQDFNLWFSTGIEHILSFSAYDHILFLIALSCVYKLSEQKKILIQITSFTIGHSLTLALSTFAVFTLSAKVTEVLIPITILLTAIFNLRRKDHRGTSLNYWMALVFGLIHGMGFSFVLRAMLGKEESIVLPLFAFNMGIEAAQLIIVASVLIIFLFSDSVLKIDPRKRIVFISLVTILFSALMIFGRIKEII